jgi:hypothetical protein
MAGAEAIRSRFLDCRKATSISRDIRHGDCRAWTDPWDEIEKTCERLVIDGRTGYHLAKESSIFVVVGDIALS